MRKITNEELHRPSAEEYASMGRIPVTVVADNIRSAQNVGAFFRTCDAFAVEHVALCGITAVPPSREIHKTALGAETTVAWSRHDSTEECLAGLKARGYRLLAVEQVEGAVMLDRLEIDPGLRYALVFGNEVEGVSQQAVDHVRRSHRDTAGRDQTFAQRIRCGGRGAVALFRRAARVAALTGWIEVDKFRIATNFTYICPHIT